MTPTCSTITPDDPAVAGRLSGYSVSSDHQVQHDFRHNSIVIVMFEGMWGLGWAFAILPILVPSYLGQLAAPRALIGVASTLGVLTVPVQLFSERLVGGANRRLATWLLFSTSALCYVLMGLAGAILPAEQARGWLIALFVLMVACFHVCQNLCSPMYQAIMTENSPVNRRGRIMAYRSVAIGSLGLLGILPARWVLQQFSPVQAYHVAMLVAGGIFLLASLCILLIRDHLNPTWQLAGQQSCGIRAATCEAIELIGGLCRARSYRLLIVFAMILVGASSLGPFLVTCSRDRLGLAAGTNQGFQVVFLAALILQGPIIGAIADRWGYKMTLVLQSVVIAVAFLVGLWAADAWTILLAYGLFSCVAMWVPTAVCNLSIELMDQVSPARLVAAANVLFLPACVLLSWGGGYAIDVARSGGEAGWGYEIVFAFGALLAVAAGVGILLFVREPRNSRRPPMEVIEHG